MGFSHEQDFLPLIFFTLHLLSLFFLRNDEMNMMFPSTLFISGPHVFARPS